MAMPCGCGSSSTCSCVLADGCGTTVDGAGTIDNPYVVNGSSNVALGDTVVAADDPPCTDYPAVMLDPDTGLLVGYWTPGEGWSAVSGGAGGVEVYAVTEDPNTDIGDPGVAVALAYDTGTPNGTTPNSSVADSLWMWEDGAAAWERYPKVIHCSVAASAAAGLANNSWTAVGVADVEDYDTANMHSTVGATGRIYVPFDGIYQVSGRGKWASVSGATVGTRGYRVQANGTTQVAGAIHYHAAGTMSELSLPFMWSDVILSAGGYIRLEIFQNSGAPIDFTLQELTVRLLQAT